MRPYSEPEATAYSEETIFISMCALGWVAAVIGLGLIVLGFLVIG